MTIWEPIRNSTPFRLYANGCPKGPLSNRGSGIAEKIAFELKKNRLLKKKKLKFFGRRVAICEHTKKTTPFRRVEKGSSGLPFVYCKGR